MPSTIVLEEVDHEDGLEFGFGLKFDDLEFELLLHFDLGLEFVDLQSLLGRSLLLGPLLRFDSNFY